MRHEARQVPSWLIFDVRQKNLSCNVHSAEKALVPIQTNCCQSVAIFHVPLPGSAKDAQRLRRAFAAEEFKKGKLAVISVKDPVLNGRVYRGQRIMLQIENPLPLEIVGERFWRIVGTLIARTKEPWWDFCDLGVDWKPKRSHPHAHALSIWRVTRKGELKYLHYEDIDWDRLYDDAKKSRTRRQSQRRELSRRVRPKEIRNEEAESVSD